LILSFSLFGFNNLLIENNIQRDEYLKIYDRKIDSITQILKKKYLLRKNIATDKRTVNIEKKVRTYIKKKQNFINKIKSLDIAKKKTDVLKSLKKIEYFREEQLFSKKKYFNFLKQLNLKNESFIKIFSDEILYLKFKETIKHSDFLLNNYAHFILNNFKKSIDLYFFKLLQNNDKKNLHVSNIELYKHYRKYNYDYKKPKRIILKYRISNLCKDMHKKEHNDKILYSFYNKNNYLYKNIGMVNMKHIFISYNGQPKESKKKSIFNIKKTKVGPPVQ